MGLAVALNTAQSALAVTSKQLAISGANVANANNPGSTRKIAVTSTDALGDVRVTGVERAPDGGLFARLLGANSVSGGQSAILDGLNRLNQTVGDPADGTSPSARISALITALQSAANDPNDRSLSQAVLTAAGNAVSTLNSASATVQSVRTDANTAMADSVANINNLLGQLTTANNTVVNQTLNGADATDALDHRDALLNQLSNEIGITVVPRANNDIAVFTDGGVTLFDKTPRSVTFDATIPGPGAAGNPVVIDGIPVTGPDATMPLHDGNLAGLATLRDTIAPTYQAQLDEMARGLIAGTAEADQSGGGGPDLAGLLTWSGGPALPSDGTVAAGLASSIKINPAVDPSQNGNLNLLRDGGINGTDYAYNTTGAAGFSDRLDGVVSALNAPQTFDPSASLQSGISVVDFSTASVGWLEDKRQQTSSSADAATAMVSQAGDALSDATGVNIDTEYAQQLQLEQSYQASSKLITVVDNMMQALLDAVGAAAA